MLAPSAVLGTELSLSKTGPETAHEGDLIEYLIDVVNIGVNTVEGINVIDTLPATVDFVSATSTNGGIYDPSSGIWALPGLGIDTDNKTAGLQIQALVRHGLVTDPGEPVGITNRAEITHPALPQTLTAQATTNIVCPDCIDWEIVSVMLDSDSRAVPPDPFETRFFFDINIINHGPVSSDAIVSPEYFSISGGGLETATLKPELPVTVSLDPGESRNIRFDTDWMEGPDSTYTISWEFSVRDISLMDPVAPNTVSGSFTGEVKRSSGGCSITAEAVIDPVWLLLPVLIVLYGLRLRYKQVVTG